MVLHAVAPCVAAVKKVKLLGQSFRSPIKEYFFNQLMRVSSYSEILVDEMKSDCVSAVGCSSSRRASVKVVFDLSINREETQQHAVVESMTSD